MTATTQQFQEEMMRLPEAERRDVLAATLQDSGEGFAEEFLHAMESARRAGEMESGAARPLTRSEVFGRLRTKLS